MKVYEATENQLIFIGVVLIILFAACMYMTWDAAVGKYKERDALRDQKIAANNLKYDEIIHRLDEEPQRYASETGARFVLAEFRDFLEVQERQMGVER